MSLMSSLYVGRSGLQISSNSLNTTAHNVTNADTQGYTRQQVALGSSEYNTVKINFNSVSSQQIGLGVAYTSTRQVRDQFLDATYRKESGRSAFYEVSYDTLYQVENILGEAGGNSFKNSIDNLWSSVQELSKDPANAVNQGLFVQRANQYLQAANSVYDEMVSYQQSLNTQVKDTVGTINDYGKAIKELNEQILKIEAANVENANDLRDSRNYYLDKLSEICNMTYSSDAFGNICIKVEGEDFVTRDTVYEMGVYTEESGFYTPYWTQLAPTYEDEEGNIKVDITNAKVVDTTREISSEYSTDIGKLESLLYARGDHVANYSDLAEDKYESISGSLMMNIMAEFDQLVHEMVTKVNDVLAGASDPARGYLVNADGSPLQLFVKAGSENYKEDGLGGWIPVEEDPSNEATMFTLGNIRINEDLMKQPTLLGFVRPDSSVDYETARKLAELFDSEEYALNPNLKTLANFADYYTNLVNQVANSGSVYKSLVESQKETVESVESARQQILGVSTDEELTNMIRFQNAYNASSRYINTLNDMLDTLLNAV